MGLAQAAIAMVAAGGVVSAIGAQQEGTATAAAQDFNAGINRRNAGLMLDQAKADAAAQHRVSRQSIGAIRAGYGASGVTSEGSVGDVIASSAALAELDRQTILYKGRLRSMGFTEEAALNTMAGTTAVKQARYRSASSLLTTAGAVAVMGAPRQSRDEGT